MDCVSSGGSGIPARQRDGMKRMCILICLLWQAALARSFMGDRLQQELLKCICIVPHGIL